MIDFHVHFGQLRDGYYDYKKVFDAIFSSGKIDKIIYSLTSSLLPTADYNFVYKEIKSALNEYPSSIATPLLWFTTKYIEQGLKIENAMKELEYGGFKLHPLCENWNFENDMKQSEVLHEIFDYADKRKMPILIHTGESGVDRPNRFEQFFSEYKNAKIILAHSRTADETIKMMEKYPNVYGDTAFAPMERVKKIKNAGFAERLIFGTDFPLTYYYYHEENGLRLKEQYEEDLKTVSFI